MKTLIDLSENENHFSQFDKVVYFERERTRRKGEMGDYD